MEENFKHKEVDWEEFRRETAKIMLPRASQGWSDPETAAQYAVMLADALIRELKK